MDGRTRESPTYEETYTGHKEKWSTSETGLLVDTCLTGHVVYRLFARCHLCVSQVGLIPENHLHNDRKRGDDGDPRFYNDGTQTQMGICTYHDKGYHISR
ncbi:hypothetical protein QE152_g19991 [Popillia japonica]|uniref:Uncharacterized protein n=1 Tax=Popillia japonica TaxID=7064 RepID=A0AAW1KQU9_POPJA